MLPLYISTKAMAGLLVSTAIVAILTTPKNSHGAAAAFVATPSYPVSSSLVFTAKKKKMRVPLANHQATRGPQDGRRNRNRNENGSSNNNNNNNNSDDDSDLFDYFDPHAYPEGISRDNKPPGDDTTQQQQRKQQQEQQRQQQQPIQSHQASMRDSINIQGGNRASSDGGATNTDNNEKKKSFAFGSNRHDKKEKRQQSSTERSQVQADQDKVGKRFNKQQQQQQTPRYDNDFNRPERQTQSQTDWQQHQRKEGRREQQQVGPGPVPVPGQVNPRGAATATQGWQQKEEEDWDFRGGQHRGVQSNVPVVGNNDNRFRDSSSSSLSSSSKQQQQQQQQVRGDDQGGWQRKEGSREQVSSRPRATQGWQQKEEDARDNFRGAQRRGEVRSNLEKDNRFGPDRSSSSSQQQQDWQRRDGPRAGAGPGAEAGQTVNSPPFRDDWQRNDREGDFRQGSSGRETEPSGNRFRDIADNQAARNEEGDLFDYFDPLLSPHAYPDGISPEKPPVDITQQAQEHQQYNIGKEQGFAAAAASSSAPFGFDLGNRDRKDEPGPPSRPRSSRLDDSRAPPRPTNRAPPPPPRAPSSTAPGAPPPPRAPSSTAPEPPPFFDPTLSPHLYSNGAPDVFIGDEGYDETADPLQYESPEFSQRQERRRRRQERQRRRRVIGILLMDHGSRNQASNDRLHELADMYQQSSLLTPESDTDDMVFVQAAHMEIASPSIEEGLHTLLQQGVESIVCHPFFLSPAGRHVAEDIPRIVQQAVEDLDIDIPVITTQALGAQTQVMLAAIHSSIQTSEVFTEEEEYESGA